MEAQASRFPDLRIFRTRQLILFRKWPVPLDVITWWMWYIYITTKCCHEVLLQSKHLLVFLCRKCDWLHALWRRKLFFLQMKLASPDLCCESSVWGAVTRVWVSHETQSRVSDWSFSPLPKHLEWWSVRRKAEEGRFGWSDWHGLTLQNESRGLEAYWSVWPQSACWVMSDNRVYNRTPLSKLKDT